MLSWLRWPAWLASVAILAALPAGCGGSTETKAAHRPRIVATTTVLGDVAHEVAGDDADVTVLMGLDDDPRRFVLPTDRESELADADLIVTTGLGYEAGLQPALDDADAAGVPILAAAEVVAPVDGVDGQPDPHVWLDPDRLDAIADDLARRLGAIEPTSTDAWTGRSDAYAESLARADETVQATLATVDPTTRHLRTDADALGYFAERYGLTLVPAPAGPDSLSIPVDALGPSGSGRATTTELLTDTARRIADWLTAHPCRPDGC